MSIERSRRCVSAEPFAISRSEEESKMLVAESEIPELIGAVWGPVLGLDIEPAVSGHSLSPGQTTVVASVTIDGAWTGVVEVATSLSLATMVAATMFEMEGEDVPREDIEDAFGEIGNIIGGHFKSLLDGSNQLGIPVVQWGYPVEREGVSLESRSCLLCEGEPVTVSLFARQGAEV